MGEYSTEIRLFRPLFILFPAPGGRSHHHGPWREGHRALPRSGSINRSVRPSTPAGQVAGPVIHGPSPPPLPSPSPLTQASMAPEETATRACEAPRPRARRGIASTRSRCAVAPWRSWRRRGRSRARTYCAPPLHDTSGGRTDNCRIDRVPRAVTRQGSQSKM